MYSQVDHEDTIPLMLVIILLVASKTMEGMAMLEKGQVIPCPRLTNHPKLDVAPSLRSKSSFTAWIAVFVSQHR